MSKTSGTGQMLEFYDDTNTRGFVIASRILFESWMGLSVGDKTALLTDQPGRRSMLIGEVRVPVSRVTGDDPHAAISLIRSLRPASLMADVSILSSFANRTLRTGVDARMGLRGITTIAEVLLPNHRELISRAFDSPVSIATGCRRWPVTLRRSVQRITVCM